MLHSQKAANRNNLRCKFGPKDCLRKKGEKGIAIYKPTNLANLRSLAAEVVAIEYSARFFHPSLAQTFRVSDSAKLSLFWSGSMGIVEKREIVDT